MPLAVAERQDIFESVKDAIYNTTRLTDLVMNNYHVRMHLAPLSSAQDGDMQLFEVNGTMPTSWKIENDLIWARY